MDCFRRTGLAGGWGCMKEDGQYASVSEDQQRPAERADLLVEEYDYQTAVRLVPYAAVGYERENYFCSVWLCPVRGDVCQGFYDYNGGKGFRATRHQGRGKILRTNHLIVLQ